MSESCIIHCVNNLGTSFARLGKEENGGRRKIIRGGGGEGKGQTKMIQKRKEARREKCVKMKWKRKGKCRNGREAEWERAKR